MVSAASPPRQPGCGSKISLRREMISRRFAITPGQLLIPTPEWQVVPPAANLRPDSQKIKGHRPGFPLPPSPASSKADTRCLKRVRVLAPLHSQRMRRTPRGETALPFPALSGNLRHCFVPETRGPTAREPGRGTMRKEGVSTYCKMNDENVKGTERPSPHPMGRGWPAGRGREIRFQQTF